MKASVIKKSSALIITHLHQLVDRDEVWRPLRSPHRVHLVMVLVILLLLLLLLRYASDSVHGEGGVLWAWI